MFDHSPTVRSDTTSILPHVAALPSSTGQPLYLNLGAGNVKLPGFLNIDLSPEADLQLDLTQPLPWPDRSVAGIYSEHFIEHLSQEEGIRLLLECRRVLVPGGIFRVATPDLQDIIRDYADNLKDPVWERYGYYWTHNRCERLNLAMREWGHKWLFDEEELVRLGRMLGYTVRARCALGQSIDPIFRGLETRDSSRLVIEFQKPDRTLAADPQPLVSIVIPSYNPAYFERALQSARDQTYRHLEIVICDDCRSGEIRDIALAHAATDARIRYIHNTERLKRANMMKCFDEARGEFIKYLNDDDELAPACVQAMLDAFAQHPDISLVTSRRQRIDSTGQPLGDILETLPPVPQDAVVQGLSLGTALVTWGHNFVGEPTTVMFRKADLEGIQPDLMSFDGVSILSINDIAMWLHLAMKGDTVYLLPPLSRFRIHAQQSQNTMREELQQALPANMAVIRNGWARFGLAEGQYQGTIRWRPLSSRDAPWQMMGVKPDSSGWEPISANAGTPLQVGTRLLDEGQHAQALALLAQALSQEPANPEVLIQLARLSLSMQQAEQARSFLREAMTCGPDGLQKVFDLGRALAQSGRSEDGAIVLEVIGLQMLQGEAKAPALMEKTADARSTSRPALSSEKDAPRLLAFYLPQFHTIPENNAWWGEGFTEWTNVRQAQPLYEGHAQPLVPGELGYYDLSSVDVMARQAELARAHGLHGFCFHYYWFDGKRLLEKPVDQLLQAPHIDLPFCLCWANENWTRRWDGGEHEILMQQSYTPALNERFARDLLPYFADARYIRIDGKPVLLVYRTDIIPDLAATVAAWRETWRSAGVGEVYLIAVESFQPIEPDAYGFDAAAEFPPHQVRPEEVAPDEPLNLIRDCDARVGDYGKLSTAWLDRPRPLYKRMRGLIPGWDNSSRRRKGGATLFVNATPAVYEDWLAQSVAHTLREFEGEERLVFINAWNEWAEGCTLEPSAAHGRAHLEATRRVMQRPQQELLAAVPPQPTAYQRWLSDRPDLDTGRDTAPATTLHLQVAIAAGDPQTTAATRQSLQAQHRPADKVVSATADSSWVAALDDSAHSWTLLLAPGDTLEMDALARLEQAVAAADAAGLRLVYSDHDELDSAGRPEHPFFKPDFNHALLLSYPYVGRALLVRTAWARPLLAASGGRFDLTLAYRLALQALAENGGAAFRHVALPLLHLHPATATVFCTTSEDWQALAGVLQQHLQAQHPGAQLVEGPGPGTFHVVHPLPRTPRVSIIIPTRDQLPFLSRCVESLLAKTTYPDFELLIVDNDSQTPEAREYLAGLAQLGSEQIRIVPAPGPFNFSRMNNQAARLARGELLLLLNNDTAALHEDWLSHLVRHALQDDVGIVGARLLYPDSRVQHAGVVLGLRGPAEHPCLGLEASAPAYMMRAQVQQDFSAVTAACMLVRKDLYLSLGGLDEDSFGVSYNDVDFCLRVGQSGKRVVWTPLATLLHEGSASQKRSIEASTQELKVARFTREQTAMYQRWPRLIAHDPAYNPNLSLAEHGYEIETNPLLRPQAPRTGAGRHVLAFAADTFGCGQYRVLQPLQAMMDAGLCSGGPSPEPLLPNLVLRSGADTLVFQRPNNDVALDMLEALVQLPGIRKIYEVDDNLARVPLKSAHHQEMPKDLRSRINRAIGLCDRLVVSTDALAHELAGRCGDTRVVPNRLPPAMWGSTPPRRTPAERSGRRPRVGWAGGIGHQGDLMLLAELVRDLADTVDWVFFGMCPPAIRPYVREFHPGVPTLDYPARLMQVTRDWDLAIAPLELNAFNECKSNLRLLEYGWCGLPVVCTDITPYQGSLPVTRVKNRYKDWREAILSQLQDPAASLRRGLALQQQVQADWTLTGPHLDHWYRAWTDR